MRLVGVSLMLSFLFITASAVHAQPVQGVVKPVAEKGWRATPDKSKNITVKDRELKRFIKANKEVREIRDQRKDEILSLVKDNGFTINRYRKIVKNQISEAHGGDLANAEKGGNINISDQELQLYKKVKRQVKAVQENIRKAMRKAIKKHNFSRERFRKIAFALRENEDLQERFHSMK